MRAVLQLKCIFYSGSYFKKLASYFRAQRAGRGWGESRLVLVVIQAPGDAGWSRALVMGTERYGWTLALTRCTG